MNDSTPPVLTRRFNIRCTEAQLTSWTRLAERTGYIAPNSPTNGPPKINTSEWVREVLDDAVVAAKAASDPRLDDYQQLDDWSATSDPPEQCYNCNTAEVPDNYPVQLCPNCLQEAVDEYFKE